MKTIRTLLLIALCVSYVWAQASEAVDEDNQSTDITEASAPESADSDVIQEVAAENDAEEVNDDNVSENSQASNGNEENTPDLNETPQEDVPTDQENNAEDDLPVDQETPTEANEPSAGSESNDEDSSRDGKEESATNETTESSASGDDGATAASSENQSSETSDNSSNGNESSGTDAPTSAGSNESNDEGEDDNSTTESAASGENSSNGDAGDVTTTAPDSSESNTSSESHSQETDSNGSSAAQPFKCSKVGRFPNKDDCQSYIFCWSEDISVVFNCKSKSVFDPKTQLCVYNWAVCASTPKCESDRQVLANPKDNKSFFLCKLHNDPVSPDFVVLKKNCDKHLVFDPEVGVCHLPEVDAPSSEEDDKKDKEKFKCTEEGVFIDMHDETKYYKCEIKDVAKGKFRCDNLRCPPNHVFSLVDEQCIPLGG